MAVTRSDKIGRRSDESAGSAVKSEGAVEAATGQSWPLRVVVDTNRLSSEELRAFLAAHPGNRAVLPDYVAMERFKSADIDRLLDGFSVLKPFSEQVLILKGTGEISTLNPDVEDFPDALIDEDQTAAFSEFCRLLDRAAAGDETILDQLRERAKWAQDQMAVVLGGASDFSASMAEFEEFFSASDLAHIRKGGRLTEAMNGKFDTAVSSIAGNIFQNAPAQVASPSAANWPNHFIVRNALCNGVYMLSFIRRGIGARRPEKARNDVIDVLLATYGTYFNGVMSNDALTNEVHHIGRYILDSDGVELAADYLQVISQD